MFRSGHEGSSPVPHVSIRVMVRQLIPGLILPGAIYFLVAQRNAAETPSIKPAEAPANA